MYSFKERFISIITDRGRTLSPTELARDFNLRWRGRPVTVNATRKWLKGDAIPTMDKLTVLANLLETDEDWLRWGDLSGKNNSKSHFSKSELKANIIEEKSLIQDLNLLSPKNKKIVCAIVEVLLKDQYNGV